MAYLISKASDADRQKDLTRILDQGTELQEKGEIAKLEQLFSDQILPYLKYFGDEDFEELSIDIVKILFVEKMYRSREETINGTRMLLLLADYFSDEERDEDLWDATISHLKFKESQSFPFEALRFYRFFREFRKHIRYFPLEQIVGELGVGGGVTLTDYIFPVSEKVENQASSVNLNLDSPFGFVIWNGDSPVVSVSYDFDPSRRSMRATSFNRSNTPSSKTMEALTTPEMVHRIGISIADKIGFERYDILEQDKKGRFHQSILLDDPQVGKKSYWANLDL